MRPKLPEKSRNIFAGGGEGRAITMQMRIQASI